MNRLLDTDQLHGRIHEIGVTDEHGREPDETVQARNEFWHLRHLHAARQLQTDEAACADRDDQQPVVARHDADDGRDQRDRHAEDAVQVAPPRGFLVAQPTEREDEQDRGCDVGRLNNSGCHGAVLIICGTSAACAA